jgi:hypothetical protein
MNHVFICPPTFIIVINIFRKSTNIHNSEMGVYIWPFIRSRFSSVIKASPHETALPKIIFCGEFPPIFGFTSPPWCGDILVWNIASYFIFFIFMAALFSWGV